MSFHATKVYNTVESGALVCHDEKTKKRIDYLKNFGFADEVTVVAPGINGKMDEIRSDYGLINLKQVDEAISLRQKIVETYCEGLKNIPGIRHLDYSNKDIKHNFAYFPIFIDKGKYGISRDELYENLKKYNIYGRRYFYPLISNMTTYKGYDSAHPDNLPAANNQKSTLYNKNDSIYNDNHRINNWSLIGKYSVKDLLRLCIAIMLADGVIETKELEIIRNICEIGFIPEELLQANIKEIQRKRNPIEFVLNTTSIKLDKELLKVLVEIAAVDGNIAEPESKLLYRIAEKFVCHKKTY